MSQINHIIILGDVIGSSSTNGVQSILHNAVKASNALLPDDVVAPFEITRGDEIALVCQKTEDWFQYILYFSEIASDITLRWIVVDGTITEGLETQSSAEMMGPGFIAADKAMQRIKKSGVVFAYHSSDHNIDKEISGILNLYFSTINRLTSLQHTILRLYKRLGTQQAVAEQINKSQQQVQKTLQSIQWQSIDMAESAIKQFIKRLESVQE